MEICNSIAFFPCKTKRMENWTPDNIWEHITEMPSFYKGFYKISGSNNCNFYHYILQGNDWDNEEKNLCWFINRFWITNTVEMCIQQPVIRNHMNLAWQQSLWKWILTDWICYETSSFYPETVKRSREMDASAIAQKIFINSLLLNAAELKYFWKTYSCSWHGTILHYI